MNYLKILSFGLLIGLLFVSCEEETALEKAKLWSTEGIDPVVIESVQVPGVYYKMYILAAGEGRTPYHGDYSCFAYSAFTADGVALETTIDSDDVCYSADTGSIPVQGLEEGILNMRVGMKCVFEFPSELGYGDSYAFDGKLAPNSVIKYNVELSSIN
jgi:hypothetical protein